MADKDALMNAIYFKIDQHIPRILEFKVPWCNLWSRGYMPRQPGFNHGGRKFFLS